MKFHALAVAIILAVSFLGGCERVDQAVDTYKKAKDLKSDFQKQSDEVKKGIEDKTEDYKDRIRKKVGFNTRDPGKDVDDPDHRDEKEGESDSRRDHDDRD